MKFQVLTDIELFNIKGGGEPLKPIPQPRDRYDDEEQVFTALSGSDEEPNWRGWLKRWLEKDK